MICILGHHLVFHLHDVNDNGSIGAFDKKGLFVGTTFIDESRQCFFTPGTIDFGKPLSELVGSPGIDTTNSDSEQGSSLTRL